MDETRNAARKLTRQRVDRYLGSDIGLHCSTLFLFAFEDGGSIARKVLNALQGCFAAGL